VANDDHGAAAQTFMTDVVGSLSRGGFIAVHIEPDRSRAQALVSKGSLEAAIVIPAGFSAAVQTNQPTSMEVIGNPDAPISTEVARSIAEGYTAELNRIRVSVATALAGGASASAASVQDLVAAASRAGDPVAVRDVTTATKQLNAKSFYAAGMAVFFVFFTVGFGLTGLLEERANGTLARLVAAPIPRWAILAGKMLTSLIMGLVSMTVLVVATTILFGASWGNPLGVAVLVIAAVLAALAIMALVVTLAKNAEQAGNWQSLVGVVLGMLGGTFFPVSLAPGVLSTLTLFTPQAWFLRGLGDLRSGSFDVVWTPVLTMLGMAVVAGGIALTRLKRLAEA
jgi:ABC-2 type transport system permease protein